MGGRDGGSGAQGGTSAAGAQGGTSEADGRAGAQGGAISVGEPGKVQSLRERVVRASHALRDARSAGDAERMIARHVPELRECLESDAAAGAFARWGLSTVIDENAGEAVVSREVFELLHSAAGLRATWPIGNAGLLHVYGYVLSPVPTPFGFKRERWLGEELSSAFGLEPGAFVAPALAAGADASHRRADGGDATVGMAGPIGAVLARVVDAGGPLARSGTGFDVAAGAETGPGWSVRAIVDEFAGEEREDVARAVLVEAVREPERRAVVYAIVVGSSAHLVTAFPVSMTPHEWLGGLTSSPPRLRYNAAAHELPPRAALAGRRVHDFRAPER